jgi:hypothetical protein
MSLNENYPANNGSAHFWQNPLALQHVTQISAANAPFI